jgi:hypothetical protein
LLAVPEELGLAAVRGLEQRGTQKGKPAVLLTHRRLLQLSRTDLPLGRVLRVLQAGTKRVKPVVLETARAVQRPGPQPLWLPVKSRTEKLLGCWRKAMPSEKQVQVEWTWPVAGLDPAGVATG